MARVDTLNAPPKHSARDTSPDTPASNGGSGATRQDDAPTSAPVTPERAGAPRRAPNEILTALAALPDELDRTLHERSSEDLLRPARDGGWGVVEVLPHLRDWEEVLSERIDALLSQERPRLPAYDDDLWAIERDYRGQEPRATLASFRALRQDNVARLRDLPPEAWHRTGEHDTLGEVSLQWLTDHICDHDAEHLEQIRDALA
ncbi:MAG: DinB family protein [Chloroflexota bacterium]|nr:DinB family protein [Chloroflexota bacterium]